MEDNEVVQILPDQHHDDVDEDGLCQTCASIPWEDMAKPSETPPIEIPLIHQTTKVLRSSTCRVCRFLGNVITTHEIPFFPSEPPYHLKFKKNMAIEDQHIGELEFVRATSRDLWPLTSDVRVLVIQKRSHAMDRKFQSLMIGGMPLEVLKDSMAICQQEHGHECSPKNAKLLQDVKVLDCETCEVVPAPTDCSYVALSYVWGARMTNPSMKATLMPGNLPRTVADSCFVVQSLGYKYLWVDRYVSV
jgi:hypothetical protein